MKEATPGRPSCSLRPSGAPSWATRVAPARLARDRATPSALGQHGAKILSRPGSGWCPGSRSRGGIRRHGRHCGADPLRHLQQYPLVYLRQQDQKLSPPLRTKRSSPQLGGDALADPAQDLVTGLVAEAIVDLFEVIEIQHDEAGEMLPLHPVVILVEEEVAVVEAG